MLGSSKREFLYTQNYFILFHNLGIRSETVMFKVGSEGLRPEIPATCPPVLRDLMQRCWDGDRTKRPSVDEIIKILGAGKSEITVDMMHRNFSTNIRTLTSDQYCVLHKTWN